jgi:hypothetical protein
MLEKWGIRNGPVAFVVSDCGAKTSTPKRRKTGKAPTLAVSAECCNICCEEVNEVRRAVSIGCDHFFCIECYG